MNFQVTVLKILVSYPDGFAVMEDLERDMAILAASGPDWADRMGVVDEVVLKSAAETAWRYTERATLTSMHTTAGAASSNAICTGDGKSARAIPKNLPASG